MPNGAYYNEIDPEKAAWLRELIRRNVIAPGEVDERDIRLVRADELRGYTQCHFFAGIGIWSYALREAGWPDAAGVWTGSCPCQPFSDAGASKGFDDERHLWPHWFGLIRECRPRVVFGEQVASKDGLAWLDVVHADMESETYAVGAVDTCAAGFGCPGIRQRFFFVADAATRRLLAGAPVSRRRHAADEPERLGNDGGVAGPGEGGCALERTTRLHADGQSGNDVAGCGAAVVVGNAGGEGLGGHDGHGNDQDQPGRLRALATGSTAAAGELGRMVDADGGCAGDGGIQRGRQYGLRPQNGCAGGSGDASSRGHGERRRTAYARRSGHADRAGETYRPGPLNGFWRDADWLRCTDGRWRPVEPGAFPLATGAPARLLRLRGYGDGINAEVAREFIEAYLDVIQDKIASPKAGA